MHRPRTVSANPAAPGRRWPDGVFPAGIREPTPLGHSSQDALDRLPVVNFQAFASGNIQATGIESQLPEHRGMDVGDIVRRFDRVKSQFIPVSPPKILIKKGARGLPVKK